MRIIKLHTAVLILLTPFVSIPARTPDKGLFGPLVAGEVRFASIGDSGSGGSDQLTVAKRLEAVRADTNFDLLIFLGDNIYPSGSPSGVTKKLLMPYSGLYSEGVELRGVIGNHDARSRYGVLLQQMIFGMGPRTHYSFGKGDGLVEFFALDSTLLAKGDKRGEAVRQLNWLETALAASKAKWKIAALHHPLYSSAAKHGKDSGDEDEMARVRRFLEPIFRKHGVSVVLSGHDHVYERIRPQFGIHYFVSGAGAKLRKGNLNPESSLTAAGNDLVRSFIVFSVTKKEIRFRAVSAEGSVIDSGSIAP